MDERVLNKPAAEGGSLSVQERSENARLFLEAARAAGCFLPDAVPDGIVERVVRPTTTLNLRLRRINPVAIITRDIVENEIHVGPNSSYSCMGLH